MMRALPLWVPREADPGSVKDISRGSLAEQIETGRKIPASRLRIDAVTFDRVRIKLLLE